MPLTATALAGVAPQDAGAASGLVNVMQQVGGSLGLAVLVTVFGSASRHAAENPDPGASAVTQAHDVFVYGADRAFLASAGFLVAAIVLITVAIRTPRPVEVPAEEALEAAA